MGLDQYLKVVSKVDIHYKNKFRGILKNDDLEEIKSNTDILFYDKESVSESFDKSLRSFFTPVKVENYYIDLKKAFNEKTNKNIEDFSIGGTGYSQDGTEYYLYNKKTNEEIILSLNDEDCEKYSFPEVEDEYAINIKEELSYWRKTYYLQNYMRDVLGYDGNCYYMELKRKDIEMLIEDFKKLLKNPRDKSVLSKFTPSFDSDKEYVMQSLQRTIKEFENCLDIIDDKNLAICYFEWY